ncbi:MAG: response regulator [Spirochaetales bacterium]|nr:response regulator [Spirochaetales bacterium]
MNILVVDDLSFMRSIIRDILVAGGYSIAGEASDGRDCLEKYEEVSPDLVLLDIAMPRMDGLACLRELKKRHPASRVVMCSSLGDQERIIKAIQLGASDFVVKPFQKNRLLSAVKKALNRG